MLHGLLVWWVRRLAHDATLGLRKWAKEPEWPLLAVTVLFLASFLFHWIGYRLAIHRIGWSEPFFATTEWEGRTGWRKPLVFGISNAMVFISLREALRAQQLVPRRLASHWTAWCTAFEVGIITLQAWRGVGSHFNTSTALDAALYGAKLSGAAVLGSSCFAITAGFMLRPAPGIHAAKAVALHHGLLQLCIAVMVGVAQAVYGHLPRQARSEEDAQCLFVTAGVSASPCYEIHGQAIVKLAHFLPLHVTEILLLLAWATVDVSGSSGPRVVSIAAACCWSLTCLGLWLTLRGEDIKRPSMESAIVLFASLASIISTFIYAFVAPLWAGPRKGKLKPRVSWRCVLTSNSSAECKG